MTDLNANRAVFRRYLLVLESLAPRIMRSYDAINKAAFGWLTFLMAYAVWIPFVAVMSMLTALLVFQR